MQNVATGKSELAALPLRSNSDSSYVIENSSEFKSLLYDARDKEASFPIVPKEPETSSTNQVKSDKTESQTETQIRRPERTAEVADEQASVDQSLGDLSGQQKAAEPVPVNVEIGRASNDDSDVPAEVDSAATTIDLTVQIGSAEPSIDLSSEIDIAKPAVDILDLLERSQFKEITISQGHKASEGSVIEDVKGLIEHLKTLTEQGQSSADPETAVTSAVLNKLIASLEELNTVPKAAVPLIDLINKIQSDIALENNAGGIPIASSDKHVELDVDLLSLVTADDDIAKVDSIEETPAVIDLVIPALTMQQDIEPQRQSNLTALETEAAGEINIENIIPVTDDTVNLEALKPIVTGELIEAQNVINPAVVSKDIQQLLVLSPEKLDKALENLATRIVQIKSATVEGIDATTTTPNPIKQDFIASLKTGIEEIKSQLKQSKQTDVDLKSFVADSLNRVSLEITPESVTAAISRFSQTLELSSTLVAHASANAASATIGLESATGNAAIDRVLSKENQTQTNVLQTKQTQQQVVQFEKAVNVVRNEGQQQLVEKVRWMVNQNNLQADIRLDPPELGAMKVRVSLSGETASVNIVVQSQQAKDLLDSAAPKLRDLLEEQGIQLGQSSVQQEQQQNHKNSSGPSGNRSELVSEPESEEGVQVTEQMIVNGRLSGIDYFV